jgi:hypothetical protein
MGAQGANFYQVGGRNPMRKDTCSKYLKSQKFDFGCLQHVQTQRTHLSCDWLSLKGRSRVRG